MHRLIPAHCSKRHRQVRWLIMRWLCLIVLVLIFPTMAAPLAPMRSHPELLAWAAAHPDTTVKVIVQKGQTGQRLEQWLVAAGGVITHDLPIINAFAAEVPSEQVARLATHAAVRWLSWDAPVVESACNACLETGKLQNLYNLSTRADSVWNRAPYLQGQGVGVAVVDSGINILHPDLANRVIVNVDKGLTNLTTLDGYGHGTLVAGVIAGNGRASNGAYVGIAPKANLINVKVATHLGISTESDVVAGLQWIYNNHTTYNIRVVNLSLNSSMMQSYHTSPMSAAVEVLWFNGIVVVAAAGNNGTATLYPPANDPFIITVGATDEVGTPAIGDDLVATFSAYGNTEAGFAKPDLVAPGRHLVGPLTSRLGQLALLHPTNVVNNAYLRMSGTSVAAPVVSGAVALLLQDEPGLTPDQVKYRLMATANKQWSGYSAEKAGAGYLDIEAAVRGTTDASANGGVPPSNLLTTGNRSLLPVTINLNGINQLSVNWSSVNWSSVNWSSVNWSSDYWEPVDVNLPALVTGLTGVIKLRNGAVTPDEAQNQAIFLPLVMR